MCSVIMYICRLIVIEVGVIGNLAGKKKKLIFSVDLGIIMKIILLNRTMHKEVKGEECDQITAAAVNFS